MCIQDGTYCSTSVAKQRQGTDQFKDYFILYGGQGDEWTDPGLVISHLCYCYHAIHYSVAAYRSQFSTFLCDSPTVCDNGWLITIVLRQMLSNAWGIGPTWNARCCENGTASVVRQPTSAWSTGPNTGSFKTIVFISPEDGSRVSVRNVVHIKHNSENGQMQKQCNLACTFFPTFSHIHMKM